MENSAMEAMENGSAVEEHVVLKGIGVCAGTAAGTIAQVQPAPIPDPAEKPSTDPAADGARVREAMAAVAQGLRVRAQKASGKSKDVLEATAQLASDKGLAKAIDKKLKRGDGITHAVAAAAADYAAMLAKLGGYMAERVTDLNDVRDRVICELRGLPAPGIPTMDTPMVLLARDLAPAETSVLEPGTVLGIITEEGGPTSHTAILAAQLGIPTVVRAKGALAALHAGDTVALDGGSGRIIVSPTPQEVDELTARAKRRAAVLANSHGEGRTKDGVHVELMANIGTVADVAEAAACDCEGVGLFRTEFLFLNSMTAPTVEDQAAVYTEVLKAFGSRRVVVRTLDAGADKPLAFANQKKEANPALGVRGLRLGLANPELLDTQLDALAQAHKATDADLWVMAPMVATVDEAEEFARKARQRGLPSVGVMIETPAAAIRSADVMKNLDFSSLGTNDLAQYTMAADRLNPDLTDLLSPWQPAVLQMIGYAASGTREAGSHIGVCGEAGGDPLLALVLAGLGVQSLSMAPAKVAAVRASLSMHTMETCKKMAEAAVAARNAEQARQAVLGMADPAVKDLL